MGEDSVALLLGARLATRSHDTQYPFRQDSDFWYLAGFDHPQAVAVLRTDGGAPYTLFVEPRNREAETWTGYRPGTEGAKRDYGADQAFPIGDFEKELPGILSKAKQIYHVLGRERDLDAKLAEILGDMRLRSRQGFEPASIIADPRNLLHEMRLRKEPAELEVMRRAAAITAEAHREAARLARDGRFEYELAAMLEYTFRRLGASGPAYTTIVGSGRNATTLHYTSNDKRLVSGELVLIDAACELEGYATDVTRTYPVGGSLEGPARGIYEVVLAAQDASLQACKPGATLELHAPYQSLARPRCPRCGHLQRWRKAPRARAGHGIHGRARDLRRRRRRERERGVPRHRRPHRGRRRHHRGRIREPDSCHSQAPR
jgi:Xaa-Pro aminopeptidase